MDLLQPGINGGSIAVASAAPFGGYTGVTVRSASNAHGDVPTAMVYVGGGYFDVLKVEIVAGRPLFASDLGTDVAVVNQALASLLGIQQAVGQRVRIGTTTVDIVGVSTRQYDFGFVNG